MADPEPGEERRELERRAFGRDGSGLSPAEAARLTELRRADAAAPGPEPAEGAHPTSGARPVPERAHRDEGPPPLAPDPPTMSRLADGSGEIVGETGRSRPFGTARERVVAWFATGRGKRPRYLIGTAAALILVGLLIGWGIPRPPDVGLALRSGEAERRDALLHDAKYDPGSVLLLDRQADALLWTWTEVGGQLRCAALDVPGLPMERQCQRIEDLKKNPYSLQVNTTVAPASGRNVQVGYGGVVFLAGRGFPGGAIQRWEAESRTMNQGMSDAEIAATARISAEQQLEGLSIVGRWRGLTIWRGYADGGTSQCLIVEAPETQRACGSDGSTYDGSSKVLSFTEPVDQRGTVVRLELAATRDRPSAIIEMRFAVYAVPYLIITENANVGVEGLLTVP